LVASWKNFFFETNEGKKREINARNVSSGCHNHILRWRRKEKRGYVRANRREKDEKRAEKISPHAFNINTTPLNYRSILMWRRNGVFNSWGKKQNTLKHTKRSTHNLSQHSKDYDERVAVSYRCEDAL
jgi:hypothetical protein